MQLNVVRDLEPLLNLEYVLSHRSGVVGRLVVSFMNCLNYKLGFSILLPAVNYYKL